MKHIYMSIIDPLDGDIMSSSDVFSPLYDSLPVHQSVTLSRLAFLHYAHSCERKKSIKSGFHHIL